MGDGSGGANTADSYIGSLISLTSKSEIRYEGILYMVDTENSNIALQNVRSFGTEGRKKDGPPISASDKVYEYIVFRGSDIKDLQVKSSPSAQPPPPQPPTDPAIVSLQSQASQPVTVPSTYVQPPPPGPQDAPPQLSYPGLPPSAFRPGVPQLYQPAAAWGPHGGPNGNLAMPMYWPGYYRPPGGQLLPQQMPPQPPPTLPQPPLPQGPGLQQMPSRPSPPLNLNSSIPLPSQLQSFSTSAPTSTAIPGIIGSVSSTLSASVSTSAQTTVVPNLTSLPGNVPTTPIVPPSIAPAAAPTAPPASIAPPSAVGAAVVPPVTVAPTVTAPATAPAAVQGVSAVITPASKNPRRVVGPGQPTPPQSHQFSGASGASNSAALATPMVASVTSTLAQRSQAATQAFPSGISAQGRTSAPPPNPSKQEQKPAEPLNSQSTMSAPAQTLQQESQALLPLPAAPIAQRQTYVRRGGRGRGAGSGRGIGVANPTQQFTEDFDFTAMNEKFNKDAVWGVLGGKGDKLSDAEDEEGPEGNVDDDIPDGTGQKGSSDVQKMPIYVKDEFFDSLSCDALDREGGRSERTKFSEQRKLDTETFGNFPMRSRGGRRGGRRGGYRGGFYNGSGGGFVGGRGSNYGSGRGSSRPATAIN